MTVLSHHSIWTSTLIYPLFVRSVQNGMTYGCGPAGYDIRIREPRLMWPLRFCLASTIETFDIPNDVVGVVHNKSTWARRGIDASMTTVLEPGWRGFLTLELHNRSWSFHQIQAGDPIAQVIFYRLDSPATIPYRGRYQDQPPRPVPARELLHDEVGALSGVAW